MDTTSSGERRLHQAWWAGSSVLSILGACASNTTDSSTNGFGDEGAVGGSCRVNADCADSAAAGDFKCVRCLATQVYCLAGVCHANCANTCQMLRTDVNPCSDGGLCAPLTDRIGYCSVEPISCASAMNCPQYRPPDSSGAVQDWTCTDHVCRYPGISYATK